MRTKCRATDLVSMSLDSNRRLVCLGGMARRRLRHGRKNDRSLRQGDLQSGARRCGWRGRRGLRGRSVGVWDRGGQWRRHCARAFAPAVGVAFCCRSVCLGWVVFFRLCAEGRCWSR